MKRFHVHVSVPDLPASIGFYSRLFGTEPSVRKADYAKWMLDDPRVNFAISTWGATRGVNHLGLQADSADELAELGTRFATADAATTVAEADAHCCYARSDKHWVQDPQGIAWEAFHTLDSVPLFERGNAGAAPAASCCAPADAATDEPRVASAGCCAPAASGRAATDAADARSRPEPAAVRTSGRCCG